MPLLKLLGVVLIIFGFWLLTGFPGKGEHQRRGFAVSGIFIGLLCILAGIILLWVG
jgi:hypothetical protein